MGQQVHLHPFLSPMAQFFHIDLTRTSETSTANLPHDCFRWTELRRPHPIGRIWSNHLQWNVWFILILVGWSWKTFVFNDQCISMSIIVNALWSNGWAQSSFIIENIWNLIRFLLSFFIICVHIPSPRIPFRCPRSSPCFCCWARPSFLQLGSGVHPCSKRQVTMNDFWSTGFNGCGWKKCRKHAQFSISFLGKLPEEDLISTFG